MVNVVSVVIRVRNAAADLERCLGTLKEQDIPEGCALEIIVVDNDSTDGSADIAHDHGALVLPITTKSFTWGRALNWGIDAARGEIVVLLSADAYAADRKWLGEMLKPFTDATVAAVYGRQLPRPDAPIDEYMRLRRNFGTTPYRVRPGDPSSVRHQRNKVVSNACAAIRRSTWTQVPFSENSRGAEDRLWSDAVLKRGHVYVYQASARVLHSHRDRLFRHAYRTWELFQQGLIENNRSGGPFAVVRALAGLSKKRLCNCMQRGVPLRLRLDGITRLPFELSAFSVVAFCEQLGVDRQKIRSRTWG